MNKIDIPNDFILGAAASAWQTEGWKGKKPHQDSYIDLGIRRGITYGTKDTDQQGQRIFTSAILKMSPL